MAAIRSECGYILMQECSILHHAVSLLCKLYCVCGLQVLSFAERSPRTVHNLTQFDFTQDWLPALFEPAYLWVYDRFPSLRVLPHGLPYHPGLAQGLTIQQTTSGHCGHTTVLNWVYNGTLRSRSTTAQYLSCTCNETSIIIQFLKLKIWCKYQDKKITDKTTLPSESGKNFCDFYWRKYFPILINGQTFSWSLLNAKMDQNNKYVYESPFLHETQCHQGKWKASSSGPLIVWCEQ